MNKDHSQQIMVAYCWDFFLHRFYIISLENIALMAYTA